MSKNPTPQSVKQPAQTPEPEPSTTRPAAPKPEPQPEPVKPSDDGQYTCNLDIRENGKLYKQGERYEGAGLQDPARLRHLIKRGTVRPAEL